MGKFTGGLFFILALVGISLYAASIAMDNELDSSDCADKSLKQYNKGIATMGAVIASVCLTLLFCRRSCPVADASPKSIMFLLGAISVTVLILSIMIFAGASGSECSSVRKVAIILMAASGSAVMFVGGIIYHSLGIKDKKGVPVSAFG